MLITRRIDYGLRIMLCLGIRPTERINTETLSDLAEVPRPFLLKIVHSLAQSGMVVSRRGVGGGVKLGGSANEISLYDIIHATDRPSVINRCLLGPGMCSRSEKCGAHRLLVPIQEKLDRELQDVTLADRIREQTAIDQENERPLTA